VKGVTQHRKNSPQQDLLVSFVRVTESVLVSPPTLPAGSPLALSRNGSAQGD